METIVTAWWDWRVLSNAKCQMRNVCHRIWKDWRHTVRFDDGVSAFHHHFQREFNLGRTCCSILQHFNVQRVWHPTSTQLNIYYWAFVSWHFLFIFYFCTFVLMYENVDARLSYHRMNAHWITNAVSHYTLHTVWHCTPYIQQFSMISLRIFAFEL